MMPIIFPVAFGFTKQSCKIVVWLKKPVRVGWIDKKWKKSCAYGILMRMRNEQSTGEESYEKISSSADPGSSDHDDRQHRKQKK